ncbi:MAG: SCO family protein [Arenicella sp.]
MFKEKKWSNRLQLIMLFVVFLAPLVGAYYMYQTRDSREYNTVNNGEFYPKPLDLENIPFVFTDGKTVPFAEFERKWYLVVIADKTCGDSCEENLLKIRQLKRMQGKNVARVVSLFVPRGLPADEVEDLTAKYSLTTIKAADSAQLEQWLQPFYTGRGQAELDAGRIYMIDPLGKLMMSYPAGTDPKGVYKDLKRLLKVAQVG